MPMTPEQIRALKYATEMKDAWRCAGCDSIMHPMSNCRMIADKPFCMACYNRAFKEYAGR